MISNGGRVVNTYGFIGHETGSNNSVLVTGSGSLWTNSSNVFVGDHYGCGNSLVISNGATVFNGDGYIGYDISTASNSALVTGSGSVWTNSTELYVGWRGSSNSLVISSSGTVFNSYGYIGNGNNNPSSNNSVLVTDSGALWKNSSYVYIGSNGSRNSLVITNGGTVVGAVGEVNYIGNNSGANSNSVLVSGSGSAWTNATEIHVGDSGRGNSLVINDGGAVVSVVGLIGSSSGANSNSVLVSGGGSVWTNSGDVYVGYTGCGNSLVITNGGTVVSSNLFMGYNSSSSNNFITVSGGNLTLTNPPASGVLDVRRGTLTMNSGTITADQFWATNGVTSIVIFNGGTLTFNSKLVTSNGAALWYGLGTNSNPTVTTSNLTLGCTLNVTDAGGFTNGTYTLFSYGGTLTYNGVTVGTVPSGYSCTINTNTVGKVNLTVTPPPPVAVFSGDLTSGTAPLPVTFTDASTGNITNRFWDFGDLVTSNTTAATTMSHTYTAGTYNVSLTVSGLGGTNTQTQLSYITSLTAGQISVTPPNHDFGGVTTNLSATFTFVVTNSGGTAVTNGSAGMVTGGSPFTILSGTPFSIPGFGSTNVVVRFAPVTAGVFTNNVAFGSANGGVSTNQVTGTGAIAPIAVFTGSPTNGVAPLPVTFTDASTGNITNRFWNFGDLATSNTTAAATMSHTYTAGTYNVSLTVSGLVGSDTSTRSNYIVAIAPAHLIVSPPSRNYGTNTVGMTSYDTFSVTNSGQQTLTGSASVGSPFAIVAGSGSYSVPGSGTNNIVIVAFSPVAEGTFSNTVIFASNGGDSTNAVTGTGVAMPPVALFTGSPTSGMAPLVVAFSNESTGTVTDVAWDFGDGGTSTEFNPTHTYSNVATFSVSLAAMGPVGSNTLNRSGYITVSNPMAPVITEGPTVTNALVQIGNLAAVMAGDTNMFTVGATDPGSNQLSYQWLFGDGAVSDWSSSSNATHAYVTNCSPYVASVTVSNGWTAISTNLTVTVACPLTITKMAVKVNFAKTNSDSCSLTASLDLGTDYHPANKVVTVDVGGTTNVTFMLDGKGKGKGVGNFGSCKLVPNKKVPGSWTLTAKLAKGTWRDPWGAHGLVNDNVPKTPPTSVTMPVVMVVDTEAFAAERSMIYTAKVNKSGSAK